jgi:hypothetical protein
VGQVVLEVSLQRFKQQTELSKIPITRRQQILHCHTAGFRLATDRLFGPLKQQFGAQELEMSVREWLGTQGHLLLSTKCLKTCQDWTNASVCVEKWNK